MGKLRRSNLSEAAYAAVKKLLLSSRYSPGGRIGVEQMSRDLGVSRTPVWDALNKLEAEGMVEIVPRKGVYLVNFSREKAEEIYLVREALEGMAARLAAERMTERQVQLLKKFLDKQEACLENDDVDGYANATIDFHNCIVHVASNRTLERSLKTLYGQIEVLRLRTLYLPLRLRASFKEHQRIFEALLKREPALSEDEARHHIRTTMADAVNILEQGADSYLPPKR